MAGDVGASAISSIIQYAVQLVEDSHRSEDVVTVFTS
jgi:hypothetical protein